MKVQRVKILTFAEKCKNILASNWEAHLNTIKADAQGSKQDIHTSKVKYLVKKGRPYLWVPEKDLHNVNTIIDERASFAVTTPFPGPLANLLRSMKKVPPRVALSGEVEPLYETKTPPFHQHQHAGVSAHSAMEKLREALISEQKSFVNSSYAVSGILSSTFGNTSRSENLVELLDSNENYTIYKFSIRSCTFVDGKGGTREVDMEDLKTSKADSLSSFAAKIIDGINQSETRRRALMIFCFAYFKMKARDAYMVSIDRKGFDVLGKVPGIHGEYLWKDFRFAFEEDAPDMESFCFKLVEMEEKAIRELKNLGGLA